METKRNRISTALQLLTFTAAILLGGEISGVAKTQAATPLPNPPSASAQGQGKGLEQRVNDLQAQIATLQTQVNSQAAVVSVLQQLLAHFSREGNNIFITGANLNIVNGLGATNGNPNTPESVEPASMVTNGVGNLIVGYNEGLQQPTVRSGSHNIVVGPGHSYAWSGGLVAGFLNSVSGPYATVTGGDFNNAVGVAASVTGGSNNSAIGEAAIATGGSLNRALGDHSTVVGGTGNTAHMDLQTYLQLVSQFEATVSNLLQKVADIEKTIIGNLKP